MRNATIVAVLMFNTLGMGESLAADPETAKAMGKSEVSFKNDVQPILQDHCVSCHAPGRKGYLVSALDLTSYEGVMKGTKFGPVVIPGDSNTSTFTKLLTGTNAGLKMPMGLNASGTLEKRSILILRKWVTQGAQNN